MTQLNQVYKCNICGNIIELVHEGAGELVCCGQPMELKTAKTEDEGKEKHVPVIEKLPPNECTLKNGYHIKVGEVAHPMTDEHYIEWIEIITKDDRAGKKFLRPGDEPAKDFHTKEDILKARCYCNLHGLWESK
ncbi:MAG: desulfoferrodoxin [Patescibacteria group bacterium]